VRCYARPGVDESDRAAAGFPGSQPEPAGDSAVRSAAEETIRTCPNCGRFLEERRCKLFCPDPRCGYFLSCADYY
jgi:hypothetical protein